MDNMNENEKLKKTVDENIKREYLAMINSQTPESGKHHKNIMELYQTILKTLVAIEDAENHKNLI